MVKPGELSQEEREVRFMIEGKPATFAEAVEYAAKQDQAAKDAAAARLARSRELELQACGLVRQYGFFLPNPAKDFFRALADFLNWQKLKGVL